MGSRLPPLPTVSELVRLYKLSAKKHLSQNFLLDMNLCTKIVRSAGSLNDCHVCEVGPGPGGITRAILNQKINKLYVIEKDRRFLPSLEVLSAVSDNKLDIYHGDVLNFDTGSLFKQSEIKQWGDVPPDIHIIGNLPFNISNPLIIKWLEAISNRTGPWEYGRTRLTLTFQKEVAERIVSPILTNERCRLSIMCQYLCHAQIKFIIPGSAFVPPPKVQVGVVHFVPRKKPLISQPFKLVEKVTRNVFHYRQKMCKRGVEDLFPKDMPELTEKMFELSQVNPKTRPFALSVDEVGRLCHVYDHLCKQYPYIANYDHRNPKSVRTSLRERANLDNFEDSATDLVEPLIHFQENLHENLEENALK